MEKILIEQMHSYSSEVLFKINNLLVQLDKNAQSLTKGELEDMISSRANTLLVAKTYDGEIVGMIILITYRIPFVKKGILEDLVVDEMFRKKGIGTKLIAYAKEKAKKEGVSYLDFTSRPTREAANKLYQKLGFVKRDTNVYRIPL